MQAFLHSFKRSRVEREDRHGGLDLGAPVPPCCTTVISPVQWHRQVSVAGQCG